MRMVVSANAECAASTVADARAIPVNQPKIPDLNLIFLSFIPTFSLGPQARGRTSV
jgi:hypothetical protein